MKEIGKKDNSISMEIIRIKENDKPYRHKIIDGPKQVHTVFYPTVGDDGKTVKMAIPVPDPWKNVFAPLANADVAIKKSAIYKRSGQTQEAMDAAKKVKSEFSTSSTYHCLILDKMDEVPVVKHAEYKYSVYRKILELEKSPAVDDRGNKDEAYLRYGLLFMIWLEIMRGRKGESKVEQYDTEYTVKVLEKFLGNWENKIPSYLLRASQAVNEDGTITLSTGTKSLKMDVVKYGMLTEEEFQAILNFPSNLEELVVPFTHEQTLEKLQAYPIKLDATDEKGNFLLPEWQEIKEQLESKGFDLPLEYTKPKSLSAPKEKEVEEDKPKSAKKNDFDELFGEDLPETTKEQPKRGRPSKSKEDDFNFDKEEAEDVDAKEVDKDDPLASLLV